MSSLEISDLEAGGFVFVDEILVTSDQQSVTFTGLDGDAAELYVLSARIRDGASAGDPDYSLRPNGLVTDQQCAGLTHDGTATTHITDTILRVAQELGQGGCSFVVDIDARREANSQDLSRTFMSRFTTGRQGTDAAGIEAGRFAGNWNSVNNNLTTLEVYSSLADGIGNGSVLRLYRVRKQADSRGTVVSGQETRSLGVVGVNAFTVAETPIFTVPPGREARIWGAWVKCTAAVAVTVGAEVGIGVGAGADDVVAQQKLSALLDVDECWRLFPVGKTIVAKAGDTVSVGVDVAPTGTSQTLEFDLVGYLK